MGENERRYVRVASNEAGLLEFMPGRSQRQARQDRCMVPVSISSVACEGLGLQATQPVEQLRAESRIDVRMMLNGEEVDLPGRVAWISADSDGQTTIGVALLLSLATMSARQMWANWIVATTERHMGAVRARGSSVHSIQHVSRNAVRRAATAKPTK